MFGMKHYRFADEPRILKRVKVRLVLAEERGRFDELLETKHYLCSARIGGQSLRYVAELVTVKHVAPLQGAETCLLVLKSRHSGWAMIRLRTTCYAPTSVAHLRRAGYRDRTETVLQQPTYLRNGGLPVY